MSLVATHANVPRLCFTDPSDPASYVYSVLCVYSFALVPSTVGGVYRYPYGCVITWGESCGSRIVLSCMVRTIRSSSSTLQVYCPRLMLQVDGILAHDSVDHFFSVDSANSSEYTTDLV